MEDAIYLNRFKNKSLEVILTISKLNEICEELLKNPSKENLDYMTNIATDFQEKNEELNNAVIDFLKSINKNEEEIELTSNESEFGYKI